jgi:hypothetical protein
LSVALRILDCAVCSCRGRGFLHPAGARGSSRFRFGGFLLGSFSLGLQKQERWIEVPSGPPCLQLSRNNREVECRGKASGSK